MSVDLLFSAQCSAEDISRVAASILADLSLSSYEAALESLSDSRIPSITLAQLLLQLRRDLAPVENRALKVEFASLLCKFSQMRVGGEAFAEIQDFYVESLELNGQHLEAARFLAALDAPAEDAQALERLLRIAEAFYAAGDYGSSFSYFGKTHSHVFRLATPRPLLVRFDRLRGNLYLRKASFLEAARAFSMLWRGATDQELRGNARRLMSIALIFAPQSPNRTGLLAELMTDEFIKNVDVYPMLDRFVRGKFIDAVARDEFLQKVVDVVSDDHAIEELEKSSTQHNLTIAQHMFVSVKLTRLAQLIGNTPENVAGQLGRMIDAGTIQAEIDQPDRSVLFLTDDPDRHDKAIAAFCTAVSDVAADLKALS
jgi:hypothetical protein